MRAFIAVTDPFWLQRIRLAGVGEANFWQPRPTPVRQDIGTPWLFKVKGKNEIAGYGIFSYYSRMPASVAWETFGIGNGAASYREMINAISRLRRSTPEDETIGCVVLSNLLLLEPQSYIAAPNDWQPNIVRGKYYDLGDGPGAVAWLQLHTRSQPPGLLSTSGIIPGGYGAPSAILPRLGQGAFRLMVMDAYERRCAISGEKTLPVLEAAHIRPFADVETHDVRNGVLLRSDIHRLFDQGLVTITTDNRFRVSSRIRDQYNNGVIYYDLHDRPIRLPNAEEKHPDRSALEWHSSTIYRE